MPGDDAHDRSVVRVRSGELVAGAGLLLAPDLVVTCAHVVADADDDVDLDAASVPDVGLDIDFPLLPDGPRRRARVERWWPPAVDGSGDVALLRLEVPVAVGVPPVRRVPTPWGRPFRVLGFPPGREDGVWATGVLRDEQGSGWVQLTADGGPAVGPGYSGAPVWDEEGGSVVGLAVAADRATGRGAVAYALPVEQVVQLAPEVVANPYRGLAAFGEDDAEFFFGRAHDVRRCEEVLDARGLVVVAGRSGTGKSSLLLAGLVPAARARGRRVARTRFTGVAGHGAPSAALVDALDSAVTGDWAAVLERGAAPPSTSLLLVVDQLEDLTAAAPDQARAVIEMLLALAAAGVEVATTSRWSAFDALLVGDSAALLARATVALTPLDREGLRLAVAEPARRVPGPTFAPGLVARIVDDAGDEPGRLPLVQALLAELWEAAEDGVLTDAAYERVGRVDGALVRSAEQAWAELGATDQDTARAVLVAQTRPSEDGFVRAALPLEGLDDDRRRVVGVLAARRLVVSGAGPEGDVAELAHQSLVDHWPRLRGWLETDAAFLRWRAGLRAALERWTPDRDPGTLLRGGELDTALDWRRRRGGDLDGEERALVEASRLRRRRERGLRRGAVAVLCVLVLIAGALTVVVTRANDDLTRALDTANANALGRLAQDLLLTDPGSGTRLALAAYRADPADPEARTALGSAYLARRSTIATHPVPVPYAIGNAAVDRDVDVTVLPTATGATVVEGLAADAPSSAPLPGAIGGSRALVGGRGRWVVLTDPTGMSQVWDRRASDRRPQILPGRSTAENLSPEGTELLRAESSPSGTDVSLRDLVTGIEDPLLRLADRFVTKLWRTADPRRIIIGTADEFGRAEVLSRRDTVTGAAVGPPLPASAAVALGGNALFSCSERALGGGTLSVDDAATGVVRNQITVPSCNSPTSSNVLSADGAHLVGVSGSTLQSPATVVSVIDLRSGRLRTAWTAARGRAIEMINLGVTVRGERLVSVVRDSVDVAAFSPTEDGLDRAALAEGSPTEREPSGGSDAVWVAMRSLSGSPSARLNDRVISESLTELRLEYGERLKEWFYGPSRSRLFVTTETNHGPRLRELRTSDLMPLGTYDLGAAGVAGLPTPDEIPAVGAYDGRLVVLSGGVVSTWSTVDQRLLAPARTVTVNWVEASNLARDNQFGLVARDGRVALRRGGGLFGGVEVWETSGARPPLRVQTMLRNDGVGSVELVGDRLSTLEEPGQLVQRDAASGAVVARTAVPPEAAVFLDAGRPGQSVTSSYDTTESAPPVDFWDRVTGRWSGRLAIPEEAAVVGSTGLPGQRRVMSERDLVRIDLDPTAWRAHLCALQDRPFTEAELALLPAGTDPSPPCAAS